MLMTQTNEAQAFDQRCDAEDPLTCTHSALQALIDDAPGHYQMGFLAGIQVHRRMVDLMMTLIQPGTKAE